MGELGGHLCITVETQGTMQLKPTVKKIPADSVPYGRDICTRGDSVWAAYSEGVLICIGATADEARRKYRQAWASNLTAVGREGKPRR